MTVLFWVGFVIVIPGLLVLLTLRRSNAVVFTTLIASTLGVLACLSELYKRHRPADIATYEIGAIAACLWLVAFRQRRDRTVALTAIIGLLGIMSALLR